MAFKTLTVISNRCTGCRICEQWCSWQHFGFINPYMIRLRVHPIPGTLNHEPRVCLHCPSPACIAACPVGAIRKDEVTGGLILDEENCLRCSLCVEACTNHSLMSDPHTKIPLLCDLCGGSPQCVAHCPEEAIR